MQLHVLADSDVRDAAGMALGEIGDGASLLLVRRPLGMRMRTMKNSVALPSPFLPPVTPTPSPWE